MSLMADVFGDRQFLVEAGGLKHDADAAADFVLVVIEVEREDLNPADLRRNQGREQAEEVVLPPPLGPERRRFRLRGSLARSVRACRLP